MASAQQASYQEASHQQQQRFVSQQEEESVREMEQIRHTNATLDMAGSDSFRAQTEQAAIRIVTPHYKIPEKPGTDVKIGSSVADLSAKFAEANGADYKAERAQEHFRMQIIDPKVASHAHIPGHAIRDYARRHLIGDFPSLHGKRSFLDLDALEQLRLRKGNLGEATDRDRDLDKFLKNRDGKRWDLPAAPKPDDESLREMDRLRHNIDHLQKASFQRSKSLQELRQVKMTETNGKDGKGKTPIEVSIEEMRERKIEEKPMNDGLLVIGVRKAATNSREKFGSHFSPKSQFFAQQINESPSSSSFLSASSSTAGSGKKINGQQKSSTIKIIRQILAQKEDKAIQTSIEEEAPPPSDWRREFLLVGNEEGADIWEWQGQTMETNQQNYQNYGGYQQQEMPTKSILKQPISTMQQTTNAYTLQHAGNEPGQYWEDRGEVGLSVETDEQQAIVEQMQRNLAMHRQPSPLSRSPYPAVPYDGPFFRLHEISPNGKPVPVESTQQQMQGGPNSSFEGANGGFIPPPPPPPPPGWTPMKAAAMQQGMGNGRGIQGGTFCGQRQMMSGEEDGGKVAYWSPLDSGQQKQKPELSPPKNMRDPERVEEFMRQERQQQEAEMAKEKREMELRERQIRALQMQQQLMVQKHQHSMALPPGNHVAFSSGQYGNGGQSAFTRPGTSHSLPLPQTPSFSQQNQFYQQQASPRPVRIFEARPLSSTETDYAFQPPTTWRRTYILDEKRAENIDERNEILTSEETLLRERFDIDLLKRRESFIEKPERPPEIKRLGRRWEPPSEKQYRWPSASPGPGALAAQSLISNNNQSAEHRWTPVIRDPGFKAENKNFTPEPSPPNSPIRGHGTGPLEDVAFRQNAGLIRPSPDGSHRPKAEFSRVRRPPSGGFVPHAPNAVRVVRRRESHVEEEEQVHPGAFSPNEGRRSSRQTMGSEGARMESRQTLPPPDDEYDYLPNGHPQPSHQNHKRPSSRPHRQSLPRHSSTIVNLEPLPRVEVRRRINLLEARSERSRSTAPRSSGTRSPSAQRSLERMQRLTAPSPAPASYKRAKRFVPPALPSGIRARHIPRVDRPSQIKSEFADFKDQIREMLEMNGSGYSESSLPRQANVPTGGGLTDTSSPTWQFNGGGANGSFSPHSLVSVNGAHGQQNGLLKVVATTTTNSSSQCSSASINNNLKERSIVKVEPPQPIQRKEIVEIRREIVKAPTVKHTVHRVEEKKRTEEVERRVIRRERRHKSRRMHRSHHSSSAAAAGGGHHEYHYGSWAGGGGGGGGGYRSSSASRRSAGYTNGFGGEHHLPIAYEEGNRFGRESSAASDRFFGRQNGFGQHARYGSVSDSLRRGDLKYGPNGELLVNGGDKVKHHRVHKAHSTRDVFYHGDGGANDSHYSSFQRRGGAAGAEPFVEFPPTLDRRSEWSGGPEPPPHRRQFADEFGGGGVGHLTKTRSLSNWEGRDGLVPGRHGEDMARLENEFRDARLMRIPSGNMHEKEHHRREIPGGYESYSRETKAHSDRKLDGGGTPVPVEYNRETSQDFKRDGPK